VEILDRKGSGTWIGLKQLKKFPLFHSLEATEDTAAGLDLVETRQTSHNSTKVDALASAVPKMLFFFLFGRFS
jgi:hypothetical protein